MICPHCHKRISAKVVARELGRKGGKRGGASTSEAKALAAKLNGAKGGRPISWARQFKYGTCPASWRFLKKGEIIQPGDRTFHVSDNTYIECLASVGREAYNGEHFIREIK